MKPAIALLSIVLMAAAFFPAAQAQVLDSDRQKAEGMARGAEARAGLPLFAFEDTVMFMARGKGGSGLSSGEGFNRRDFTVNCSNGTSTTCSGTVEYCLGFCHGFCGEPCQDNTGPTHV